MGALLEALGNLVGGILDLVASSVLTLHLLLGIAVGLATYLGLGQLELVSSTQAAILAVVVGLGVFGGSAVLSG